MSAGRAARGAATTARAHRFAAKLLFQFRVVVPGAQAKRRTCEERIVVFRAATARAALREARRRGHAAQFRYRNSDGNPVLFELVGVADLLELGPECGPDEVWYDVRERVRPMERRRQLLRPPSTLLGELRPARARSSRRSGRVLR